MSVHDRVALSVSFALKATSQHSTLDMIKRNLFISIERIQLNVFKCKHEK